MKSGDLTPEDEHNYLSWQQGQKRGKIVAGIFVVAFGVIYLLHESGIIMPSWVFSLPLFLMALGVVIVVKHKFNTFAGWGLIIIGKILLINEFYPGFFHTKLIWPIIIILIGLKIIFKPKNKYKEKKWKNCKQNYSHNQNFQDLDAISENDFIDSVSIFGGVNKNVVSKNFKGADIVTIFGGTEINLLQAEFENQAIINLECVFGGVSIIMPANWQLKSDVVTIFGGVEDKRQMTTNSEIESKILILKGNCVFGGIEVKSFK